MYLSADIYSTASSKMLGWQQLVDPASFEKWTHSEPNDYKKNVCVHEAVYGHRQTICGCQHPKHIERHSKIELPLVNYALLGAGSKSRTYRL